MNIKKGLLILILILAATLRFYGLNWDQGYHLHPDERWITMVTEKVSLPSSIEEFLSSTSTLNPKFFAYGSLPIYLLKFSGTIVGLIDPSFAHYNSLNLPGRMVSVLFDLGTLVLVFLIGKKVWSVSVGLLAAFFYAIAVFPIQNAHFYTVDTQLTFWIILTLYLLIKILDQPALTAKTVIGVVFGAALATKITAVLILPTILLTLVFTTKRTNLTRKTAITYLIFDILHLIFISSLTFLALQPYALIDFARFKSDILSQSQMTRDATVFPYTIQYVGTTPYLYQLKNLVLWGLGTPLGILAVLGVLILTTQTLHKTIVRQLSTVNRQSILLSFFWIYFLIIGASAVKFMRYFLPLYPILTLAAAFLVAPPIPQPVGLKKKPDGFPLVALRVIIIGTTALWTLLFMQIYTQPHTRVAASDWINQNIPSGSTLAIEHWDDALPLNGGEKYQFETLELYEPDSERKINQLIKQLALSDYLIISSNRLYDSIPKLPDRYPTTIRYYDLLFNEKLGFKKIKAFTAYPHLKFGILNLTFRDSVADESFTVYDHPKVMIFKKVSFNNAHFQKLLQIKGNIPIN